MNLPNKLTVLRIILIPLFLFFIYCDFIPYHFLLSFLVFTVASLTDLLDGKIARKQGLVTDFGKFMDPLADKLLVISAMVAFVGLDLVPSLAVIIILARELLVTSLRLVAAGDGIVIAADKWGKYKTTSQMLWVCFVLISGFLIYDLKITALEGVFNIVSTIMLIIVLFLTVYSGYNYMALNKDVFLKTK